MDRIDQTRPPMLVTNQEKILSMSDVKPWKGKLELPLETTNTFKMNSTITIRKAPMIIPLLLPLPPTMKAAQMRKVVLTGFMKSGQMLVFNHAQRAPASAAIAAPNARLAALWVRMLWP